MGGVLLSGDMPLAPCNRLSTHDFSPESKERQAPLSRGVLPTVNPRRRFRLPLLLLTLLLGGCGLIRTTRPPVVINPASAVAPAPAPEESATSQALYYYSLANLRATGDDLEGAAAALQKAREFDPHSSYLDLALAEVYLRQGNEEKGLRAVEDAQIDDPDSIEAHSLLGSIYLSRGNFPGAVEQFRAAVALAPDDEDLMLQLVVALTRKGDNGEAVDLLKGFIAGHPQVIDSRLALARLYRETGLDAQAEKTYLQLVKDHPDLREARLELARFYESRPATLDHALKIYRELLAEVPSDTRLRNHLAAILINAGQLDAARKELEALLAAAPGDLEARRKLGLIAIEQEHWKEAVGLFRGLLEERPDLDQARYYLGVALERQGDAAGAIDAFAAIPGNSSFGDDALMHRAYLLATLKRSKEAIDLLEARLAATVDRPDLFLFLVSLYTAEGKEPQALAKAEAGLKVFPDNLQLHYQHGVLLERAGEHERATAEMERVLKGDPEHAEALNYLAYRWAERNENLPQALKYARLALKKSDLPHIRDTLGWVLYRLGDFQAAVRELQKAAAGLPDDPIVREHLADACHAAGLDDLAVLYYRKLLETKPEDKELQKKLDKALQQLKN